VRWLVSFLGLIGLILLSGCPTKECFENPNLWIPPTVQNITIEEFSNGPTFIGQEYFQFGTSVNSGFSPNEFFSVTRFDPVVGIEVTFYWNSITRPPFALGANAPFGLLEVGEVVNVYLTVVNTKVGDLNCIFASAEEIHSILDVKVRVEDGKIVGEQLIEQTRFDIPAGQHAVFSFPIVYEGLATYSLNLSIDTSGALVETKTTDNNYTLESNNLGT
jgi:hypothetical protein